MKVSHRNGEVYEYCQKAIGDPGGNIHAIYLVDSWLNPGRQIKLCQNDLNKYQDFIKNEREAIANLVKEVGFNGLSERQKLQYRN